jgi:hypothetical protein
VKKKEREAIPVDTKRLLLVECGFKCSVPNCLIQWPILQFHHIDEDPSNNRPINILLLCPTHHQMVTSKHIDRKSCQLLKQSLSIFSQYQAPPQVETRNRLLYSLAAELHVNLNILNDRKFLYTGASSPKATVYPRLLHAALDQAISSGVFIHELDAKLFKLLYNWAEALNEFNHRLDLTEYRTIVLQPGPTETASWHSQLIQGEVLAQTRRVCTDIAKYLISNYSHESGVCAETIFFPEENTTASEVG